MSRKRDIRRARRERDQEKRNPEPRHIERGSAFGDLDA